MSDTTLYTITAVIFIIILISTIIMIRNIFNKKVHKPSKNTKKKMHELRKIVSLNPKDLDSLYELALIEEEYNELTGALPKFELLLSKRYFNDNNINEIEIYKKMEAGYGQLEDIENSFKYAMMISKLDPNNIDYAVKIGNVLGKEGKYKLASEYFNKVIVSKENLTIEEARTAALSFFMIKDYKKSIIFLEELYKKISNDKETDILEIYNLEILLVSLYISADELNIAITFLEQILSNKNISEDHKLYVNRIYMYILYKLSDNNKFISKYNELRAYYKLDEAKKEYAALIFDFAFYAYFLKDINTSINYFKKLNSFHMLEYSVYYLDQILDYLNEVNKASIQLVKLRGDGKVNNEKYKNENYEKYIDSELIDIWELVLSLWQGTFIKFDYITSNAPNPENKIDIDKILAELNAARENDSTKNINLNEIDKIYSLNVSNFKKLCKNLIQNKLSYSILQEYTDNVIDYNYGDEVNYLAYHVTKSRKDLTLISIKRWKNTEVGELIIRDFLLMVNESGAKNGILILPVRLSNSAKSYAKHNDKITVYTRSQFNSFLKTNFVD